MIIKEYLAGDTERLVEIWFEASITAHSFIAKDLWEKHKDDLRNSYLPEAETWVVEERGEVLGFISLVENYIGGLFVEPSAQGRGAGTRLLEQAKAVRERLTVGVYDKNEKAKKFYAKHGFTYLNQETQAETGERVINMAWEKR